MIIYLIKVQVLLLLATVVYLLFFNKETNFKFKRYYILTAVIISLSLPMIAVPAFLSQEMSKSIIEQLPKDNVELDFYFDPALFDQTQSQKISVHDYLLYAYASIAFILLIKLVFQLSKILHFIIKQRNDFQKFDGYYLAEITGKISSFSFLNFIFLNKADFQTEKEREQILMHELEHIRQRHTYDILLLELAALVCWFNPIIYFFKSQTRAIHEYLADAKVLEQTKDIGYAKLLVRSALSSMQLNLANQFHNSLTLKRLNMMKTVKKNISKWKLGMLIPGIALAVFIIACQDQIMEDMKLASAGSSIMLEYPPHIAEKMTELQQKNPDAKFEYIEGEKSSIQKLIDAQYSNKVIMFSEYNKETEKMGIIVAVDGIVEIAAELQTDDQIFLIVEETATPVGGMAVFYEFIQKKIQYPSNARNNGIEGKVFVEFIVNTDGSISDVKPIRGIGYGCDEEAVRVVSISPPWNPGKQKGVTVRQRMVLPVLFGIGGSHVPTPTIEYEIETTTELSQVNVISYPKTSNPQSSGNFQKDGTVFIASDQAPTPGGGMTTFFNYVNKNMKYPAEAKRRGIEGKVFIQFVVNPDGSISDVVALRGIGGGCDEEAVRIVSNSPAWNPGKHNGELIKQRMVLPITFELNELKN